MHQFMIYSFAHICINVIVLVGWLGIQKLNFKNKISQIFSAAYPTLCELKKRDYVMTD